MKVFLTCVLFVVLAAGCATIMHGTTQDVTVNSNPSSAMVFVDGQSVGSTPAVVNLKRKSNHVISVKLDGYQPYEMALSKNVSGWVVGNLVFGGLVGLVVDAASGGLYKLSPDQVSAQMAQNTTAVRTGKDDIVIMVTLQPQPGWEKIAQLLPQD